MTLVPIQKSMPLPVLTVIEAPSFCPHSSQILGEHRPFLHLCRLLEGQCLLYIIIIHIHSLVKLLPTVVLSAFVLLSSKTEIFSIEPYSFLFMKNKNSKSSVVNAGSSDILFTFLFTILEWQEMMLTTRALITIHFLLIRKMPRSQWKFK